MPNDLPTCFFCYAWEDDKKQDIRYRKLDFIRNTIQKETHKNINVILDRHNYDYNSDMEELRKKINEYDMILFFCTPDLKKIIINREDKNNKDREVLKEYDIIAERFENNPACVFPVILEGDRDSSLPYLFHQVLTTQFSDYNMSIKKNSFYIPRDKKALYDKFLDKVISSTYHFHQNKSVKYKNTQAAIDELFMLTNNEPLPSSCLVKPSIFNKINRGSCFLLVGRKGSGKSTFITNFREMDKENFDTQYKYMVPLSAEDFPHEYVFSSLITNHINDLNIITMHDILCLYWQIFIILHCIITISKEIELRYIKKGDHRYKAFHKICKDLLGIIQPQVTGETTVNRDSIAKATFNVVAEMIDNRYNTIFKEIENSPNPNLIITPYVSKFNAQDILYEVFKKKPLDDFISALQQCSRKIIISLDAFDTHSDDFRYATYNRVQDENIKRLRIEYDTMIFRTLVEVASLYHERKYDDYIPHSISNCIRICIVLPEDRYDNITANDRDSFKKTCGQLSWSAKDLLGMLVRRLEYIISVSDKNIEVNTSGDYLDRMQSIMRYFPGLPVAIPMEVQGHTIYMSLYKYILRSSFWRPRDVISNLSTLFGRMAEKSEKDDWIHDRKIKLTTEEVKLAIKEKATDIIEEEFYKEYRYTFLNLTDVMNSFNGFDEQTPLNDFLNHLAVINFKTAYIYDFSDPKNKLLVLYQMGIVGIRFTKAFAEKMHYHNHICFRFNAKMTPMTDIIKNKIKKEEEVGVIFNPIFSRELMLNFNNDELIGNWSDDDLIN